MDVLMKISFFMATEENKKIVNEFEQKLHDELFGYLKRKGVVDEHLPECPDVEDKWSDIVRAYIPDGAREFQEYPVVSLGWMMLIGMAMARYWDTDWEKHSTRKDYYEQLRDAKGYDNMDDTVTEEVLGLSGEAAEMVAATAADAAAKVYSILTHQHIEPGTDTAFGCYIAALHQLYMAGIATELKRLGYHMTPMNLN